MRMGIKSKTTSQKAPNKKSLETTRHLSYNLSMVKNLRLKLGLSQEELANEIGISYRTIQRLEAGYRTSALARKAIIQWSQEVEWQNRMATKGIQDRKK